MRPLDPAQRRASLIRAAPPDPRTPRTSVHTADTELADHLAEEPGSEAHELTTIYRLKAHHSARRPVDYENRTLSPDGSRVAASRLTPNEKMTITATAATITA
jgi:hypothetical protein